MTKNRFFCLIAIFMFFAIGLFGINCYSAYADTKEFTQQNGNFGQNIYITNYDNYLFVADTDNNLIQVIDQQSLLMYSFGGAGSLDGSTPSPTLIACDNQLIYVVTDNMTFMKVFDYNGEYQGLYFNEYTDGQNSVVFNKIVALNFDTYGNLFALHIGQDAGNNALIKKVDDKFVKVQVEGLSIDQDSKLLVSPSGNNLVIITTTNIYLIDIDTNTITDTYTHSISYNDIKIDYLDNLYFYQKTDNKIVKLSSLDYSTTSEEVVNEINEGLGFCFNQISGETFFVDGVDRNVKKVNIDIVEDLSQFVKPTDYLSDEMNTATPTIAVLNNSAIAYNYPYTLSSCLTLGSSDYVYILDDSKDFYFCMVTNKVNYNLTVYIHKKHLTINPTDAYVVSGENYMISTPHAVIYKYPTSLKISSASLETLSMDTPLNSGTKVNVTKFLKPYKDNNGVNFYEIELEDGKLGYIASSSIISYNTVKEAKKIKPNATIKITSEREFVNLYVKKGNKYEPLSTEVLLDGTRVRLVNNYDKSAKYTEIKYINNEGNVATAYVKTQYIALDGITFEIIIAIILVVVCFVCGLILIVIVKKSKNKV